MTGAADGADLRGDGSGDWDGSARPASPGDGRRVLDGARAEGTAGVTGSLTSDGRRASSHRDASPPATADTDSAGTAGSDTANDRDGADADYAAGDGADHGDEEYYDSHYDGDDSYRPRPFWARTSTLVVFVVLLFVASGAVTAWLRISDLQQRVDTLEARTVAAEDARQAAILLAQDLATYDYRDLAGNFRHVAANATPRFTGQLRELTDELSPELQQTRAVATGSVRSAGVVRADEGKAVVAVFVDQTVTNTRSPEPRTERSRMELTLVRQGGVWRLDQAGEL